jgi:hypothetical protein
MKNDREDKLQDFSFEGKLHRVKFVETMLVAEGVICDVYAFVDDDTRDLGIVTVSKGVRTPLERVLNGNRTSSGFLSGHGVLTVTSEDGTKHVYHFDSDSENPVVDVKIGETMQWTADSQTGLIFYEVCDPPYEEGRYEYLPDESSSPNT